MQDILKNDLVVIYMSKQSRDTDEYCDIMICKVIAAGKYDLICEKSNIYSDKLFKISKKRCIKIDKQAFKYCDYLTHNPKIGDLVMAVTDLYSKERELFTGMVENIIYDPSHQFNPVYDIRIGQEIIRAYLENIIVLESS